MFAMKQSTILISVIIPHRDSVGTLPRLISSIPNDPRIEIIIVDNSINQLSVDDIPPHDNIRLYNSDYDKYAGGARNVGLQHATGRWLLFADADDYYTTEAFDLFLRNIDMVQDILYTGMTGWNDTTNEYCSRGEIYADLVRGYLTGGVTEEALRYLFHSPCCKMIRKEIVDKNNIRFSEVRFGNDALFSVQTGHYARSIKASDTITYVATLSNNNITRKTDFSAVRCRFTEDLKINRFLRRNKQRQWQLPIWPTIRPYGIRKRISLLALAIRYGQPLMVDHYTKINF